MMEWHLKNLMTPKLGTHPNILLKQIEEEPVEETKEEAKPSCVICGKPATISSYCDDHI